MRFLLLNNQFPDAMINIVEVCVLVIKTTSTQKLS